MCSRRVTNLSGALLTDPTAILALNGGLCKSSLIPVDSEATFVRLSTYPVASAEASRRSLGLYSTQRTTGQSYGEITANSEHPPLRESRDRLKKASDNFKEHKERYYKIIALGIVYRNFNSTFSRRKTEKCSTNEQAVRCEPAGLVSSRFSSSASKVRKSERVDLKRRMNLTFAITVHRLRTRRRICD